MRTVAILQARMNSSRLPGKMLMPLLGKPLVQHVIERVKRAAKLDDIVLAVPGEGEITDTFCRLADQTGVRYYEQYGEYAHDLVARYLGAALTYKADIIVRIPCDNPCVHGEYIDRAVEEYLMGNHIFYTNTQEWTHGEHIDGLGCEVFSISRLKLLDRLAHGAHADEKGYREHPHRWFYDHLSIWKPDPTIRLDVNTMDDYLAIQAIYEHFNRNDFTAAEIVAYLETKKVPA